MPNCSREGGDRGHLIILLAMLLFFTACSSRELVSVGPVQKKKKSDALIHDVTAACSFNEEARPAVVMGLVSDGGGIREGDMWKYLLRSKPTHRCEDIRRLCAGPGCNTAAAGRAE